MSKMEEASSSAKFRIGFHDEWEKFSEKNPALLATIPLLVETVSVVFGQDHTVGDLADKLVYFLGKIAAEDFIEIFILCGNGHGIGGLKLLRGMYERVATLFYIANHPDKAEGFWNYAPIHKYKMFVHAGRVMDIGAFVSETEMAEIRAERDAVKDDYQDECEKCGFKRPLPSWIKGGMETISKATPAIQQRYLPCYYWPTLHDHATPNNIIERMDMAPEDSLKWKDDAQAGWVNLVMSNAHLLILEVLELLDARLNLGLNDRVVMLQDAWKAAWIKEPIDSK